MWDGRFTCFALDIEQWRQRVFVTVVWVLAEALSERRANEKVAVKPIGKEELKEMERIMVVTGEGFDELPCVVASDDEKNPSQSRSVRPQPAETNRWPDSSEYQNPQACLG